MDNKAIKLIYSLLFICLFALVTQAQSETTNSLTKTLVTFSFLEADKIDAITNETISELKKTSSIPLEEEHYTALIKSGFYYNAVEDRIYFNNVYDKKYSKVEIIEKYSNTHIYRQEFENSYTEQEFYNLESGTYLIILSNDEGFIEVDEVTVFQKSAQEILASQEIEED